MAVDRDLFGVLRRATGGDATPARQLSLLETDCLTIPTRPGGGHGQSPLFADAGFASVPIQVPAWIAEACKAMDVNTEGFPTAEVAGERWAAALRRRFPSQDTAKHIAQATGCTVKTAQAWLAGQSCYLHVALGVAWKLRDPLLLFELAGMPVPEAVVVNHELDAMRADLDALGERIRRLKGGA